MNYERVKVGIAIPTAGLIRAACSFSVNQLVGVMAQNKFWPECKEQGLTLVMREGSGIASNRQRMVEEAIEADCTHVLFVDDDMEFDPPAFRFLASRRHPIVGCNYPTKFDNPFFTAVHLDKTRGRMETRENSTGLEPVDYMGFGLCLIETEVFQKLDKPWFLGTYIEDTYTTEDLPFFWQARQKGIVAYCDHDASKYVKHIGIKKYSWQDVATVSSSPPSPGGGGGTTGPS